MMHVYVVAESPGGVYPYVYSSYASALVAVYERHPLETEESKTVDTAHELFGVEEDASGVTALYIEKGIHVKIYKRIVVL